MRNILSFLGFGRARRLDAMARKASNRARKARAASAGYLGREFFLRNIRGPEGAAGIVGALPLKCYRKEYGSLGYRPRYSPGFLRML